MIKMRGYYLVYCLGIPFVSLCQTVNEGVLTVLPNTDISTLFTFSNEKDGVVKNDGSFYFFAHFNNDGIYTYGDKRKSSYAVFQSYEDKAGEQMISGTAPSDFFDVLFNNSTISRGFDLKNDISIGGTANFKEGIIQIDSLKGAMVFQQGSKSINVSNSSHVDGEVEKVGNEDFLFPIGQGYIYRYAKIMGSKTIKDSFSANYYFKNSNQDQPHSNRAAEISHINSKEYWTIQRANTTKSDIILTLSWDPITTSTEFLDDEEGELCILRWDDKKKIWVDEGGVVNVSEKTVTTPTFVAGYGVFTFGKMSNQTIEGDVIIYNAVSPNGDGKNDHFIIDNIERFPNNTVSIFNRWGVKVYSTRSYNNLDNKFVGISDGRSTLNNKEKLPSGTYYYVVEYEYLDTNGSRMIKKAGYLHLENE